MRTFSFPFLLFHHVLVLVSVVIFFSATFIYKTRPLFPGPLFFNSVVVAVVGPFFQDLLPMVEEANAMSVELKKDVKFQIIIESGAAHTFEDRSKVVSVKVHDYVTNHVILWPLAKFINRKYIMQVPSQQLNRVSNSN